MGRPSLASNASLNEIRVFLAHRGKQSISDISKWNEDDSWSDWHFGNVPNRLLQQLETLKAELRDAAPVHKTGKDNWGWGPTGSYSTAKGYAMLQRQKDRPPPAKIWKEVWDSTAIPKVIFFFWTLMHKKILTGENLMKRNIAGPHRCALCKEAMETSDHLFVDCQFANKVWLLTLHGLKVAAPTNISIVDLFTTWKDCYPSDSDIKQISLDMSFTESQDVPCGSKTSQSADKCRMMITLQKIPQTDGPAPTNKTQLSEWPQALRISWIEPPSR
jgi:hypothetical protein